MSHTITRYIIVAAGVSAEEPIVKFLWEKDESHNLLSLDISQAWKIYNKYWEIMDLTVFKVVFQKKEDLWNCDGAYIKNDIGARFKTYEDAEKWAKKHISGGYYIMTK